MTEFYTNVHRLGNNILVRGYLNGKKYFDKVPFKPTHFIKSNKPSKFKTLTGESVEPIQFDSISECRQFHERYQGTANFEIFGMDNHVVAYVSEQYPQRVEYDPSLIEIGSLDIETECEYGFPNIVLANEKVNAITLYVKDQYITLGTGDYIPHLPNVKYKKFTDEVEMLKTFITIWESLKLDIVTGWNTNGFDIPYLVNRIKRLLGDKYVRRLSPWGIVNERTFTTAYGEQLEFEIVGINTIDLLDAYKKFSNKKLESYKLDTVAYYELGEKKTDYSEYGSLKELYKNNFQKFIEYNIKDTKLVADINIKTQLIQLIMNLAYDAKVNMIDTFKSTRIWDSKSYNHLMSKNIVIPFQRNSESKSEAFDGAYVQDPIPGMYEYVLHFDVRSEYPSMFMHYNVSPETQVGRVDVRLDDLIKGKPHGHEAMLKMKNLSMAANGTLYRRDVKGFAAEMIEELFAERVKYKKLMLAAENELNGMDKNNPKYHQLTNDKTKYDILQQTKKVNLNSFYGAVGSAGFRFFKIDQAEAITHSGQLTIRWAQTRLDLYMNQLLGTVDKNYVIYIDTDSIALHVGDIVNKFVPAGTPQNKIIDFIKAFGKTKIQPYLDKIFNEMKVFMNAYDQKVFMNMEKISVRAIYVKKKRYILNLAEKDDIRYEEPIINVTGVESVRSSTPEALRNFLKASFKVIMQNDRNKAMEFIEDVRTKFNALKPEDIAFPRGVSDVAKYEDSTNLYKKGTPIHCRAAILHNHFVKKLGLKDKYEYIKDGDKIKFTYLKLPNPIFENVIAFAGNSLPPEFGLDPFVDYEQQFQLGFLNPLEHIFDAIGWQMQDVQTLEDFFS